MLKTNRGLVVGLLLSLSLVACGFVDTGEVGVRTEFGNTNPVEEGQGFYTSVVSNLDIYTVKQVAISLTNLTPKAHDNLSLRDLDVTVYYSVNPNKVADLSIKYKGQSIYKEGSYLPAFNLVSRQAQSAISKEVSEIDSLIIHQKRDELEKGTKERLQAVLDAEDPDTFRVEQVTVVNALTDSSIEASIRDVVKAQKNNEAMDYRIKAAEKQATLNEKLNQTYTAPYLQHEYNLALSACAQRASCTMIVGNSAAQILNIK